MSEKKSLARRQSTSPRPLDNWPMSSDRLFMKSVCTSEELLERGNLLRQWLGVFTDYGERHRGVITTEEIREILSLALKQVDE